MLKIRRMDVLLVLALLPCAAHAQDYGSGWSDVSEGSRQNLMQQEALRDRMRTSEAARRNADGDQQPQSMSNPGQQLTALAQARMRQLAPEYNRRVQMDGRASADRWLAATARTLGQQDARAARSR
jgi:hypothetical protein